MMLLRRAVNKILKVILIESLSGRIVQFGIGYELLLKEQVVCLFDTLRRLSKDRERKVNVRIESLKVLL